MMQALPIDDAIPDLRRALAGHLACVLEAPPGSGKTTRVPLALMDEPWLQGRKIIMLEPRRVAARAAAARLAGQLGEEPGGRVGYRIRLDARVGPSTRIEVVTEGLLTRRLQSDPALAGVGLVIFDEFHERSLAADLGLALTLECQAALNEDLRILVMSATLDGERMAELLDGAPIIRAQGRMFPVETVYWPSNAATRLEDNAASAVRKAVAETQGGILVFLPGEAEIRRTVSALADLSAASGIVLRPLYGAMSNADQDAAISAPTDGRRKIVLATAIAETSLTIEDVRVVIDAGLQRLPQYDPATGLTALRTQRLSLASAEQRKGRAGRLGPGRCYRLWPEPEMRALRPFTPAEILTSDLAPFALELAQWGVRDVKTLALLDPPPVATMAEARGLLRDLEALDTQGHITPHGRAIVGFGAHPRLAHMMLKARDQGLGATAAALAAILSERDVLRTGTATRDADIRTRLDLIAGADHSPHADRGAMSRAREQAGQWRREMGLPPEAIMPSAAGALIALAYPDRTAKARAPGSFRLANGRGAILDTTDPLAREDYLSIATLSDVGANARIHLAAPLTAQTIEDLFADRITTASDIRWDPKEGLIQAFAERRFGALILDRQAIATPDPDKMVAAALAGLRHLGLAALNWTQAAQSMRDRLRFAGHIDPQAGWPDMSDAALLDQAPDWLGPYLTGVKRIADFARINVAQALSARLNWEASRRLDTLAPEHIEVPSGSHIAIDYSVNPPVLAVRLQEMFGLAETPRIGGGKVALTLHLLSPARHPVQVTSDLKSFWNNGYQSVKKDLKGRYPKHFWPDDPWTATATARAKPRN